MKKLVSVLIFYIIFIFVHTKKYKEGEKPEWAKKDIRDYNDADLERLLDQWEEDEDPLPDDELPEHLRPLPKIDLSNLNSNDPEAILQASKKGRTVMAFVAVSGNPTKDEAEGITKLWHTGLWNSHIQTERYMVDDDRALFVFKDGAQAWEAKDYFINQARCESVTIENKVYHGKHSKGDKEEL